MTTFTEDYDPGFLNVPGFGQSATNPLSPVFFESLGIVNSLSVYDSIYCANRILANVSFSIGDSELSQVRFTVGVPTEFKKEVQCDTNLNVDKVTSTERLVVNGKEYVDTFIDCDNGTFRVLARI
jgi:hypothetical protein